MKIAIDLTSLADNFSGMERYALNMALELIHLNKNKKHTFILLFKRKVHPSFEKYRDSKEVTMKVYGGSDKLLFGQFIFPFHLYWIQADIFLFLAFPSPILFHKKGIYNTIHDLTCWDCPETMKKHMQLFFKLSIWNAVLCSKGIVVNSQFTQNRVKEKFAYKKKTIVAYCGISDVFLQYAKSQKMEQTRLAGQKKMDIVRNKYHLPNQYLLCLATLEPRKNLPFLVQAYVELQEEGKVTMPLVLAGRKGWNMEEFLEQIEDKYRKNIIVTGFIEEEDLPFVYHMADCFIFPSIYEGFGMPPLEAMTVGTLVISSDATSLKEVLGKAAVYFKLGDKLELKEKICQGMKAQCEDVTIEDIKNRIEMFQWKKSAKVLEKNFRL